MRSSMSARRAVPWADRDALLGAPVPITSVCAPAGAHFLGVLGIEAPLERPHPSVRARNAVRAVPVPVVSRAPELRKVLRLAAGLARLRRSEIARRRTQRRVLQ